MANSKNAPAKSGGSIDTKTDLLAELQAEHAAVARTDALPDGFDLSTNMKVEDRTDAPVDEVEVEYESEELELAPGFVLTTFNEVRS